MVASIDTVRIFAFDGSLVLAVKMRVFCCSLAMTYLILHFNKIQRVIYGHWNLPFRCTTHIVVGRKHQKLPMLDMLYVIFSSCNPISLVVNFSKFIINLISAVFHFRILKSSLKELMGERTDLILHICCRRRTSKVFFFIYRIICESAEQDLISNCPLIPYFSVVP